MTARMQATPWAPAATTLGDGFGDVDPADRQQGQRQARRLGERARGRAAAVGRASTGVSRIGPKTANATPAAGGGARAPRGLHVGDPVRRDADAPALGATRAHVGGRQRRAAQVNAVGADGQRDVDPVVDVEGDAGRGGDVAQRSRQLDERAPVQILLAQLHGDVARREAAAGDSAQGRGAPPRRAGGPRSPRGR